MPISNVALTNTFDEWRTTTNQLITTVNDILNDGAPTITYRNVTANNIFANNINISGSIINAVAAASFDKANAANVIASASFDQANVARTHANAAFANANSTGVVASAAFDAANAAGSSATISAAFDAANAAFTRANTANTTSVAAFAQANTANTTSVAAFAQANTANTTSVAAFGRANGAVQTGWTTINANGTSITPASNADTLTIRTTGNVSIVGVSANDNIIFDLTTTGVTAAIYGNATIIPVMTVDNRGRISSVTNTDVNLRTTSNYQVNSLGVGTAASGTTGEIRATNNITAYYSDKRLKKNIQTIQNALEKLKFISGVSFQSNDNAAKYGYTDQKTQIGVIAQEIEQVLPEIVVPAPFDIGKNEDGTEYSISGENYKTVQYEKIIPLLIQAIKELKAELNEIKSKGN